MNTMLAKSGDKGNAMTVEKAALCGIEQHAVLYALLVREALGHGKAGDKAARDATARYGRERGARMAQKAIANGDELTRANYRLYKEWRPPQEGLMVPGPVPQKTPSFITQQVRCEWAESWKRHGLREFGKMYCRYVDRYLCRGWSEDYEVQITTLLSEGDDRCTFDWGYALTPELEKELSQKSAVLGDKYARNFDYHTGHLLHAMTSEFTEQLGAKAGETICSAALKAFEKKFGKDCAVVIQETFP
jgi:hypothetical protein